MDRLEATFVIPCLNENQTLGPFLAETRQTLSNDPFVSWHILVADNGSTDGSQQIAKNAGIAVVDVSEQGYGSALRSGILSSKTEWVVYADADGTYRPEDAIKLLKQAYSSQADLVVGSRIKGKIHKGAMPWIHRYLGTPVLSYLIRKLYKINVTDCNSGIRCLKKSSFQKWDVKNKGMEFASALLINAATNKANIVEAPVALRAGPKDRISHLKKWRDGMRHLLVVLAGAPWLFWWVGILLLVFSLAIGIPCLWGPIRIYSDIGIFGPHTLIIGILTGFYGTLSFSIALLIYTASPVQKHKVPKLIQTLIDLPEDILFWLLCSFASIFIVGTLFLFWRWYLVDYGGISYVRQALFFIYATVIPSTMLLGVLQAHLKKRI